MTFDPEWPAGVAWKIQPDITPWAGLKVLLIAFGLVAFIHVLHHAVHYPMRETVRAWWSRLEERRRPEERLPDHWRPGSTQQLTRRILEARARRARV